MIAFEVNDMTCGHCVSAITEAVRAVDRKATISIDLAAHRVEIEPTETDAQKLGEAIQQAGYTPIAVGAAPVPVPAPARGGCCCG